MNLTKIYFPGLNGLRFFAAVAVIFTHVELMKKYLGFEHLWMDSGSRVKDFPMVHIARGEIQWSQPFFADAGPLGVVFFFVLSGFLITYLLLAEKQVTGKVSVRAFYLRRILRIWPLYFLIFILGFFVLPHSGFFQVGIQSTEFDKHFIGNFWCYLFFLPNLAYSLFMAVPCIGQSWSIGVEEQFYIVWPVIMKYAKRPLVAIIAVTAILVTIKAGVIVLDSDVDAGWLLPLKKFLAMSKIECMTIGGLGAYAIFMKKKKMLNFVYSLPVQLLALFMIPALLFFTPSLLQDGVHVVYGFCFLIIIMNVSGNSQSLLKLENQLMNMLGKISYGIYMYHLICVVLVLNLFRYMWPAVERMSLADNLLVYAVSIMLTVVVSYLSYTVFERRFILLKQGFTKVVSGEEARK